MGRGVESRGGGLREHVRVKTMLSALPGCSPLRRSEDRLKGGASLVGKGN